AEDGILDSHVTGVQTCALPISAAAEELWSLGLDNDKKFFRNTKPETQLMIEALELGPYQRDEYWLPLSDHEMQSVKERRHQWLRSEERRVGKERTARRSLVRGT